ncbi:MAG: SGNH/GDSL hydrolase family protein [Ignavibacteria bacterium]
MNWETLMCFGDSITIGARSYCGYPEYCGDLLEKIIGNKWNVVNHSVSGYTAIDLNRYISGNFHNLTSFNPSLVTVLIGTNDIKSGTSLENFEIAYNQILIKAKLIAMRKNVLLIKIPHLPPKVMYPYYYKMNDDIAKFNEKLEELAAKNNVRITQFHITEEDLFDGVHFNEYGSRNTGKQLSDYVLADRGVFMGSDSQGNKN